MALESSDLSRAEPARRMAYGAFMRDVERTLALLSAWLRGGPVGRREFPDLRESYRALSGEVLQLEADRITNSVNTLREQITRF